MRLILYSDLHLKQADPLGYPTDSGLNSRLERKLQSLQKVVDIAIERNALAIVDLGDLFDGINPPSRIRNAYAAVMSRAIDAGIYCLRVVGNHETDGRDPDGFDASLLSRYFAVAKEPCRFRSWADKYVTDDRISLIPEVPIDRILEYIESHPKNIILGHFGVNSATYPNGQEESLGISMASLSESPGVFLGHIHKRQEIGNVVYIGALCRKDFGDAQIPTGCLQLDVNADSSVEYSWIEIPDIAFHQVEITERGINDGEESTIDLAEGDVVKLRYSGSYSWFSGKDLKFLTGLYRKLGASKVFVDFRPTQDAADSPIDITVSQDSVSIDGVLREVAGNRQDVLGVGQAYLQKAYEAI
jgi:DNA repair exonuclease SbcCD nuclease subunit